MLHDRVPESAGGDVEQSNDERRRPGGRVAFPCEIVVSWYPEVESPVRLTVIDSGPGGFRVQSSMPFVKGMTGLVRTILPEGVPLNRAVYVVWCRRVDVAPNEPSRYEAGLRYMA